MKSFNLTLDQPTVQVIWNALMEQPGKAVYPALRSLENQLVPQGAFSDVPAPPAKEISNEPAANPAG